MQKSFSGNLALICPDCSNHLINLAPNGERYHCADCDLRLTRDGEQFRLIRDGDTVGHLEVDDVEMQVLWRLQELASAV
jgi:hypothetical protein